MTLEKIKELNRRLTALLDDPQEGRASWCIALGQVLEELADGWKGAGK